MAGAAERNAASGIAETADPRKQLKELFERSITDSGRKTHHVFLEIVPAGSEKTSPDINHITVESEVKHGVKEKKEMQTV